MSRLHPRCASFAAVLAVAALGSGCGTGEGREGREPRRLFDATHAQPYSRDSISELREVQVGAPANAANLRSWTVVGERTTEARGPASLSIESPDGDAGLTLPAPLRAAEVDRIQVVLRGIQAPSRPTLSWQIQGEGPCADCVLRLLARDGLGTERNQFGFEVGSHPQWRGVIEHLTLRPTNLRAVGIGVEGFSFLRRVVSAPSSGAGAVPSPVLYTSAHETRVAQWLRPGEPLRLPVAPGRGETLRFALGREPAATGSATLEVGATIGDVRQILSAGAVAALPGWQERQLDLTALAGREAVLDFVIVDGEGGNRSDGGDRSDRSDGSPGIDLDEMVFLANPELLPPVVETERPNIVLVSIDTLRADHLSLYGHSRPTSPHLEALAARGAVVFDLAVAAAASTLPAHASMFTGLEVLRHGAYLDRPVAPGQVLVAERFRDAGYRTLAITGGGFVHPRFGLAQGFDRFRFWPRGETDDGAELASGLSSVRSWLASESERPFFLFFHTYEVHAPYRAREPYFSQWTGAPTPAFMQPWSRGDLPDAGFFARDHWPRVFGEGTPRDMRAGEEPRLVDLYDSGVARADAAIGELVAMLASAGIAERTVLMVTSDHGESLGEHGLFDHGFLYDSNLLVPLVVFDPRHPAPGRRVREQVRQIDIAPTLLALAALPAAAGLDGESLVPRMRSAAPAPGLAAWSYAPEINHGLAVRKAGLKFIQRDAVFPVRSGRDWEAYRVDEDRDESVPLAEEDLGSLAQLQAAVQARLEGARGVVHLEWTNPTAVEVSGRLEWGALRPQNVKWAGVRTARFDMPAPGTLQFAIPPRSSARVRVQALADTLDYRLRIEAPAVTTAAGSLPLATLCQGGRSLLADVPQGPGPKAAFHLAARSDLGCDGLSEIALDPELAARLRALGYLQ